MLTDKEVDTMVDVEESQVQNTLSNLIDRIKYDLEGIEEELESEPRHAVVKFATRISLWTDELRELVNRLVECDEHVD